MKEIFIKKAWKKLGKEKIIKIEPMVGSGSNRYYCRLLLSNNSSLIFTYGNDREENKTFVRYAKIFQKNGIKVAKIVGVDQNKNQYYFQEDLGKINLLETLSLMNQKEQLSLYKRVLSEMIMIQKTGSTFIVKNSKLEMNKFDKKVVLQDLFYFKFFFLDRLQINYQNNFLLQNFIDISEFFQKTILDKYCWFMYRDFQGRNIILTDKNELSYIDFQGAMTGPSQYDAVSLLFQAKSPLNKINKQKLYVFYMQQMKNEMKGQFNQVEFDKIFNYCFLVRQLQVLGAYGLKGLLEKKSHFIESIVLSINNLRQFKNQFLEPLNGLEELKKAITQICSKQVHTRIKKIISSVN